MEFKVLRRKQGDPLDDDEDEGVDEAATPFQEFALRVPLLLSPSVDALDDTAVLLADGMISIRPEVAMRCTKSLFSRQSLTSIPTAEAKRRSSCTVLLLRAGKRYLFEKIREAVENFIASFVKTIVRFLVSEEKGCQVVLQDTNTFSLSLSLPILPFLSIH